METTKQKNLTDKEMGKETESKAIRISLNHRLLLDKGRSEINKDTTYSKKISFSRYVEKLIDDHWQKPIEELKKEREGSKDWLELQHKREAPSVPFYDWLRANVISTQKKSPKNSQKETK